MVNPGFSLRAAYQTHLDSFLQCYACYNPWYNVLTVRFWKKKSAYIPSKHKGYGVHVEILHTLGRDKKLSPCNSVCLLSVNLFFFAGQPEAPEPSPRCLTAARYKWKPRRDVVCSQVLVADMFWKPRKDYAIFSCMCLSVAFVSCYICVMLRQPK